MEKEYIGRSAEPEEEKTSAPFPSGSGISNQALMGMMHAYYAREKEQGRPIELSAALRARLSARFGPGAEQVKVYENPGLNRIGEEGFASGDQVHLAQGALDKGSRASLSLLEHEFSHIAQQSRGIARGDGLLLDGGLEAAADGAAPQPILTSGMAAGAAPIQGRRARSLGERIKNWFKTKSNWHGYRERKERGKADAQAKISQLGEFTGPDDGGLDRAAYDAGYVQAHAQDFQTQDSVYNQHGQELLEEANAALSSPHYKALLHSVHGDLTAFMAAKNRAVNADSAPEKQQKNQDCIRQLFKLETQLYQYQATHPEAAEEPAFLKMMDRIQQEHRQQASIMDQEGFAFYSGNDALSQQQQTAAKQAWEELRRSNAALAQEQQETDEQRKADLHSRNASLGLVIDTQRYNGTLQGLTPKDKQETVESFRGQAMAMMARILSTDTGIDLIRQLQALNSNAGAQPAQAGDGAAEDAAPSPKRVLVRPAQIFASGMERTPGASKGSTKSEPPSQSKNVPLGQGEGTEIGISALQENGLDSAIKYRQIQDTDTQLQEDNLHFVHTGKQVLSPQYVVLAHELTHALHNAKGVNLRGRTMQQDDRKRRIWDNMEEMATVSGTADLDSTPANTPYLQLIQGINENKMRRELGLLTRNSH